MNYQIKIDNFPYTEWEVIEYRIPEIGEYFFENGNVHNCKFEAAFARIIVKRTTNE